jgi:membrane-bound ClpP family serine protease
MRSKRGQLIGGLVLLTLGVLFILDRLIILEIYISWPLVLVAVGVGLFLSKPSSLTAWVVGGIGVVLFVVNFVIAFFPEVETWSDLVWPTILIIVGVLLLYRYYQSTPPAQPQGPKKETLRNEEQGKKRTGETEKGENGGKGEQTKDEVKFETGKET